MEERRGAPTSISRRWRWCCPRCQPSSQLSPWFALVYAVQVISIAVSHPMLKPGAVDFPVSSLGTDPEEHEKQVQRLEKLLRNSEVKAKLQEAQVAELEAALAKAGAQTGCKGLDD